MVEQLPLARRTQPNWRRFWLAVALITVAQLGVRGWAMASGWFVWDDFWWHDIVGRSSVWEAAGLSLGGHFSPLTYIPYYLITAAFPYDWGARVVVVLLVLIGINAGVLAVSRQLWRTPGPQLVVYVLWVFSSLVSPSVLWFSQFSMTGASLLIGTWLMWALIRALQTRRPGPGVLAVVLLAIGMFAQERMLVTQFIVVLFVMVVCRPGVRLDLSRRTGLWTAWIGVVVVWLLVYSSVPAETRAPGSLTQAAPIVGGLLRISAIPALLGGPWVLNGDAILRRSDIPAVLQAVAILVLVGLIVWSRAVNPRALRAWSVLGLAALANAVLVVIGRGTTVAGFAVYDWRYFSDVAVLAALAVVAAFVAPGTTWEVSRRQRAVLIGAVSVFVVSSLVTLLPLATRFHQSTSRPYVQTATGELRGAGDAAVMDRVLPETVVNAELGPQRLASRVFSILDLPVRFDEATTTPLWLDDQGHLVPATLTAQRRSLRSGQCVYEVSGAQTTEIELTGSQDLFDWGVAVDYTSASPTGAVVTSGSRAVAVDLPAGTHTLYVPLPGVGDRIGVYLASPQKTVCIHGVRTGSPTSATPQRLP